MAFRSASSGVTGTGTSAAIPVPSGAAIGDVVVLGLYVESADATFTWPSGFTQKTDSGASNAATRGRLLTAWKRLTAGDTGTYSVSWSTSALYEGSAVAHSGIVGSGDPFENATTAASGSSGSTTVGVVSYTTAFPDDMVFFGTNHATNAGNWTAPTGYTERYDNSGSGTAHLAAFTKDAQAPGTQNPVATASGTTGNSYPRSFIGALTPDRVLVRASTSGAPASAAAFTVTLPTHATGDRLLIALGGKDETTTAPTISGGWTRTKFVTGGTGTLGAGTGQTFVAIYEKTAASSSETDPTITPGATAPDTWVWLAYAFAPSAGKAWADTIAADPGYIATAADTGTGDSQLTASATLTDQPTTGDAILAIGVIPTNAGSAVASTSTLTNGGITTLGGAAFDRQFLDSGLNSDVGIGGLLAAGFYGTASGATSSSIVFTASSNHSGVTALIALRQATPTTDLSVAGNIPQPTMAVSLTGMNDSDLSAAGNIPQPTMAVSLSGFNDSDLSAAGTIPQPVMAVSLNVSPLDTQLSVAGNIPQPTLAVSLAGFNDSDLSVAGSIPQPVLAVDLEVFPTLTIAATIPQPVMAVTLNMGGELEIVGAVPMVAMAVNLSVEVVGSTDTSNADDGIFLGEGLAEIVWEPDVVPPPTIIGPRVEAEVRTVAQVIDTAPGPRTAYTPATGRRQYAPAMRERVLIGGEDWTYYGGVPIQIDRLTFIDPLLYGSGQLTLPQINLQFPTEDLAALTAWLKTQRVVVQLVIDGEGEDPATVVVPDYYKGFVTRIDSEGTGLVLTLGGQASGRLSAIEVRPPVYRRKQDVEHILVDMLRDARVRAKKHDGTSGVGLIRRGGSDGLSVFNETVAVWAGATDSPITFTPNADGVYRKTTKATEGIDFTVYLDSSLVSQSLSQDFMEQPNRIYAQGFTAAGELVTNIKTPGLTQGDPPEFPAEAPFGLGDSDGTTVGGVTAVQQQLTVHNFLDYDDVTPGFFLQAEEDAVEAFQRFAGLNVTGQVGPNTWDMLWNLGVIGYSLDDAREYPMAEDPRVSKWLRSANGSKVGINPDYDPHVQPVDMSIDVGGPFRRGEIAKFAQSKLAPAEGVWTGTITLKSGIVRGDHNPGDPFDAADVMDRREVLPNMRFKIAYWGDLVFTVNGKDDGPEETQLLVSTRVGSTVETWAALERLKEAKSNPGRQWSGHVRKSQVRNDLGPQWDTSSGWLGHYVELAGGQWTEVAIPAGQEGIVQRIRMVLDQPAEFAAILSQKRISLGGLNSKPVISEPLAEPPGPLWYELHEGWLDQRGTLIAWGTHEEPLGYGTFEKGDKDVSGTFTETAGFNYTTGAEPVLYLYTWVAADNYLLAGRILRNQRTTDF
jgi:hypothetical protein